MIKKVHICEGTTITYIASIETMHVDYLDVLCVTNLGCLCLSEDDTDYYVLLQDINIQDDIPYTFNAKNLSGGEDD